MCMLQNTLIWWSLFCGVLFWGTGWGSGTLSVPLSGLCFSLVAFSQCVSIPLATGRTCAQGCVYNCRMIYWLPHSPGEVTARFVQPLFQRICPGRIQFPMQKFLVQRVYVQRVVLGFPNKQLMWTRESHLHCVLRNVAFAVLRGFQVPHTIFPESLSPFIPAAPSNRIALFALVGKEGELHQPSC